MSHRTASRRRDRVGLGAHRFPRDQRAPRDVQIARTKDMLARALNLRNTVAFVGAGCSIPMGYPTWRGLATKLVEHAIGALAELGDDSQASADAERLTGIRTRLESGEELSPEALMFFIGLCKQALDRDRFPGAANPYHDFFASEFARPRKKPRYQPLHRLLQLETIKRFITTNYDLEIERALADRRGVPRVELGLDGGEGRRSFTQESGYYGQLALFALARHHSVDNTVFHCHGRCDRPGSIVATESEYQQWYFTERDGTGPAFRQTVELLLGSNPILFVGFGLGDEDLLRPLRMFGATDLVRKHARPIFAFLSEASDGAEWDQHQALYERYGVHVIPFTATDAAGQAEALCDALRDMRQYWRDWRRGWLAKPFLRKVQVAPSWRGGPYRHYSLDMKGLEDIGARHLDANLEKLEGLISKYRVITLVGAGGAGKSWHAIRLLDRMQASPRKFEGLFFWSSYYADDLLTGIERALHYMDPEGEHDNEGSRIERFRACIRQRKHLLVFDGFERLLRETDTPSEGKPDSKGVENWLAACCDPNSKSKIIFTSRLWPYADGTEGVERFRIPRMKTGDIVRSEPFAGLEELEVSALCSLLGGHAYGLSLAGRLLLRARRSERRKVAEALLRRLSDVWPHARVSRMIGIGVDHVDEASGGLALPFLQRLAVFMSPVAEPTARICYDLASQELEASGTEHARLPLLRELIADLVELRLLFKIARPAGEGRAPVFSAHPAVRSYIFTRVHQVETDLLPNFTLPGFTSGTAAVYPGSPRNAEIVTTVFERLYQAGERALAAGDLQDARDLCRSALGVARSRMEANTAARWTSYDEYILVGLKLVNLAKKVSPKLWAFAERRDYSSIEIEDGALYADELAWLYNDIGLTLCAEGSLQDTYAVWEQGYEINKVIDSEEDGGQYNVQSQLHFAHTFIELGMLAEAEEYLEETDRLNRVLGDPDYAARIFGYDALVAYLRDQLVASDELYEKALQFWKGDRRNARAQSMFLYLRGELNSYVGRFEEAETYIQSSRSIAEAGQCPDLIAYANNSRGNFCRLRKRWTEAAHAYDGALREARRIGIRKLEADVLAEQSQLSLALGDTESARRRAMQSLRIANEMALGLKQTNALYALGLATLASGPRQLGLAYLRHTKTLADQQHYQLRARQVEKKLQEEGEEPDSGGG